MSDLLLSREERLRFIDYCRHKAYTCDGMAKQIEGNGNLGAVGKELAKRERLRAAAYSTVALDLERIEDVSIGQG